MSEIITVDGMRVVVTPWNVVTNNREAKDFVARHLDGVTCQLDVNREIDKMSDHGTNSVLITEEQAARLVNLEIETV